MARLPRGGNCPSYERAIAEALKVANELKPPPIMHPQKVPLADFMAQIVAYSMGRMQQAIIEAVAKLKAK